MKEIVFKRYEKRVEKAAGKVRRGEQLAGVRDRSESSLSPQQLNAAYNAYLMNQLWTDASKLCQDWNGPWLCADVDETAAKYGQVLTHLGIEPSLGHDGRVGFKAVEGFDRSVDLNQDQLYLELLAAAEARPYQVAPPLRSNKGSADLKTGTVPSMPAGSVHAQILALLGGAVTESRNVTAGLKSQEFKFPPKTRESYSNYVLADGSSSGPSEVSDQTVSTKSEPTGDQADTETFIREVVLPDPLSPVSNSHGNKGGSRPLSIDGGLYRVPVGLITYDFDGGYTAEQLTKKSGGPLVEISHRPFGGDSGTPIGELPVTYGGHLVYTLEFRGAQSEEEDGSMPLVKVSRGDKIFIHGYRFEVEEREDGSLVAERNPPLKKREGGNGPPWVRSEETIRGELAKIYASYGKVGGYPPDPLGLAAQFVRNDDATASRYGPGSRLTGDSNGLTKKPEPPLSSGSVPRLPQTGSQGSEEYATPPGKSPTTQAHPPGVLPPYGPASGTLNPP